MTTAPAPLAATGTDKAAVAPPVATGAFSPPMLPEEAPAVAAATAAAAELAGYDENAMAVMARVGCVQNRGS